MRKKILRLFVFFCFIASFSLPALATDMTTEAKEYVSFQEGFSEKFGSLIIELDRVFLKGGISTEAEATEAGLVINKKYQDLKDFISERIDRQYQNANDVIKSTIESNSSISDFVETLKKTLSLKGGDDGRKVVRDDYYMQILSCYSNIQNGQAQLVVAIGTFNDYKLLRSIDGEYPVLMSADFALSENVKEAKLYDVTSKPNVIAGKNALVYDNPFYFPLFVTVNDPNKPLDLVADITFRACKENSGECKIFKERVGIVLGIEKNKTESPYCQNIRNHYIQINDAEMSPVKIIDAIYGNYNGALALFVDVEYPNTFNNEFMVIETNNGLKFETIELERDGDIVKFIAMSDKLTEEKTKDQIIIVAGNVVFSVAADMVPRLDTSYVYKVGGDSISFINIIAFIIIFLFFVVVYAKMEGLPYYSDALLKTMGLLAGVVVGLYIVLFFILSYLQSDNYIKNEKEILKALEEGKNVYINATSTFCLSCKINDFYFNKSAYASGLIALSKFKTFKADIGDDAQLAILNKYGVDDAPGGIFITPELKYGISLPKKMNRSDVYYFLNRHFGENN